MYLQLVVEAERVERVELRFLHHNHPNVTTEQQEIYFKNNFFLNKNSTEFDNAGT